MKLYIWIGVLALIVFGVGWTGHAVTDRLTGPRQLDPSSRAGHRRPGSRRDRRPPGRLGIEPFIGTIEYYARELDLSDQQKAEMQRLVDEATQIIQEHDRADRRLLAETRTKVRDLLTPSQRETIDRIIEEKFSAWRAERLSSVADWLEENTSCDAAARGRVLDVVRDYYEKRLANRACFQDRGKGEGRTEAWPTHEEMEAREGKLLEERDAALRVILSEKEFEKFQQSERSHAYGRSRHGRR